MLKSNWVTALGCGMQTSHPHVPQSVPGATQSISFCNGLIHGHLGGQYKKNQGERISYSEEVPVEDRLKHCKRHAIEDQAPERIIAPSFLQIQLEHQP
jgi:hypothetical protein